MRPITLPDFNIVNLPSVNLKQTHALPDCPAIYFVMYLDGQILYIGKASNLRTRWQGHHRLSQLTTLAQRNLIKIAWLQAETTSLDLLEKTYIEHFIPLLNDTKVPTTVQNLVSGKRILQQSLLKIAPYTVVCGIRRDGNLPTIIMRYFWMGTYDSPSGVEARKIRKSLKALNRKSSTLKWVEFIKKEDTGWWRCRYSGYQIELGPLPIYEVSVIRRTLNSPMTEILVDLAYGFDVRAEQSLEWDKMKALKNRKILIGEYGQILNNHPQGAKYFPLQAGAIIGKIAEVEMLVLTQQQLDYLHSQQKRYFGGLSLHPDYSQLDVIENDPIKVFY